MSTAQELHGQVLVVTGGGSGIGAATARVGQARGATVVVVDRDPAAGTVAEELGGRFVEGSVDDPDLWERVVTVATELDGPHLVHLNAGLYGHSGPIEELPVDLYRAVVAANIDGVVLGTRAMAPALAAIGGGAIVVTASLAGLVPFPPNPVYTMTKHAVVGFVRAMAPTLWGQGITIDAVCPAVVNTPMTAGAAADLDMTALGIEMIPPETIADAVLALATSDGTGRCHAILPGRDPIPWEHTGPEQLAR